MMLNELLNNLRDQNIHIYLDGNNLRCKSPRNTLTDEIKNLIKEKKQELIELLLQGDAIEGTIHTSPRTGAIPLSYAQQRLWFLDQLEPGSSFYNIPMALRLEGPLNQLALEQGINEIIRRHENLRTTFVSVDGEAAQVIADSAITPVACVDLSAFPEQTWQTLTQQVTQEEATTPFDLAKGPLMRVRLIHLSRKQAKHEAILLVTLHHIISDGWSNNVLTREFVTLYQAYSEGNTSPLSELTIQYSDYAYWQRQWLDGAILQQQIDYWRRKLSNIPALLELPTIHPRPTVMGYDGAIFHSAIPPALSEQLHDLSRHHNVTLFVTMLTAFSILLSRHSQQTDICIGTPIANRQRLEIEELIGFFVNTLVLRVDLSDSPSFNTLLTQVNKTVLEAQSHQDLPFEQLVTILAPERSMGHSPLFQVMFTLQNSVTRQIESIQGMTIGGVESEGTTAKFDLSLHINQEETGILTCSFEYNTDLFELETITRLADHYLNLLQGVIEQPQRQVSQLPLLTESEAHQLLVGFNATVAEYPQHRCIHELFEGQANQQPTATALVYEGQSLSYGGLNRCANRLAHRMIELGIRPDDRVAICAERSLEMVIGLLGILKAGGAYVPLDPGYPEERLAYMLSDSAPVAVLTQSGLQARLPGLSASLDAGAIPVILLDGEGQEARPMGEVSGVADLAGLCLGYPEHNPEPARLGLTSRHLAYVIYTSGSTGQPKGVMVSHANVGRLFAATQAQYRFTADDTWALFHSFAFDFSVWEVWGPLFYGGRLIIIPHHTSRNPEAFYQLLAQERVTVLNQTPSAFRQLIAVQADNPIPHNLRCIIFGGEALEFHSLKPWIERNSLNDTRLINMYGITEITVHATYRSLTEEDIQAGQASNVGKPLDDLQFYILDSHLQPVPIGVAGEIYIGGAGVARGYLNRADLTAERFIADPFGQGQDNLAGAADNGRLYKTGDLGRWLPDGSVEYLGRNDFQVKIRGFRIELGEVEAQLAKCPGVREAVVMAREDVPGDKRLVAYLVAEAGQEPEAAELRGQLSAVLADYMVPSAYVTLSELPLTPNGKLDRKALPAPDDKSVASTVYRAPTGDVELALAQIWSEVLELDQVGVDDNFFAIGGDSIRSIAVIAKAKAYGLTLSVVDIFRHQTIASLANVSFDSANNKPEDILVQLLRDEDKSNLPLNIEDAYPVSFLQMGMIYHNEYSESDGLYHDVFSTFLKFPVWDEESLRIVLDAVAKKHPILRTVIDFHCYSEPLQLVYPTARIPMEVIDIRRKGINTQNQIIKGFIDNECKTSFNMDIPPLLRVFIHIRGDSRIQFTLSFHHAILDGWSIASLQTEIIKEYLTVIATPVKTLELSHLALVPKTSVILERQALQSQAHQSFWKNNLEGYVFCSLPPIEYSHSVTEVLQHRQNLTISDEICKKLQDLATALKVPMRTILLCAHLRLVSLLSGKNDVTTGLVSNVRPEESDGEKVLGLFLNTLPFRQRIHHTSWIKFIKDTFRNELSVIAHRHYPYFQLHLDNGRLPFYEIIFNYVNFHVYEDLKDSPDLAVLDGNYFEATGYGLAASFSYDSKNISLSLEVDPERVSLSQAERILGYYESILNAIAVNPNAFDDSMSFLSSSERSKLLIGFNATVAEYPQHRCIHELFEGQANQQPTATALVYEGQSLSYGGLNRCANRLAHRLIELGIRPDDRVAICAERSLEMVIGLLGILKAGGAYVPLDPGYPEERLAYMLSDSAPVAVLTQSGLQARLPGLSASLDAGAIPVILLDGEGQEARPMGEVSGVADLAGLCLGYPEHNPEPARLGLTSRHLAYVIYTSGSTGQPKGVMNQHQSVVNRLWWAQNEYQLVIDDRILQKTPFSFDVSVWEFFLPLLTGAQLVIAKPQGHQDPEYLSATIIASQITTVHFVPSMLQIFLEQADIQPCSSSLRRVLCSGEALPYTLQMRFHNLLPTVELHNLYGPTEAAVDVTSWLCSPEHGIKIVPIGCPIANTQIYILDSHLQPVPIGVAGEIYIGGAGVARGYLNRADLTAERFIADPFGQGQDNLAGAADNGRLYKTGDLGRWLPDGSVEYLGRNDFQVKIRGFRIELGEVEAQLAKCPGVREAVVMAREDVPGDKRLVAYLVAEAGQEPEAAELRGQLSAVLADYMVPSAYVTLSELPLTPNGKLDRKALPAPDGSAVISRTYEAPHGLTEILVAQVWRELLQLEQVGRHDHFFELGGHSLMVVTLIERLRLHGLSATVRTVFASPVLADMAVVITEQSKSGKNINIPSNPIPDDCTALTPDLLPLVSLGQEEIDRLIGQVPGGVGNIQDIYPLAPLQEGILFHHLLEQEGDAYLLRSVLSFDTKERLDSFLNALQTVINRHDILRTAIHWTGLPQPVQVVQRQAPLAVTKLDTTNGQDIQAWLLDQTDPRRMRVDLSCAPLFAIYLAYDGRRNEWLMALLNHHIICDHLTLELIIAEIQQILEDQTASLSKPLPYRNFIAQALAISPAEHEAYFKAQLGDITEPTTPFGILDVQGDGSRIVEATLPLSDSLAHRIRTSARQHGVTAAVLFHAAWGHVLSQCTGRDQVVFGTVLLGRLQGSEGADRVLGMFINTLPVRVDLGNHSAQAIIQATYRRLSDLLEHEQASLTLAQRCSAVDASLPLFTTLLNYRHSAPPHDNADGQTVTAFVERGQQAWEGMHIHHSEERTNYPITVSVDDLGQGFSLTAQCMAGIGPERITNYLNTAITQLVDALSQTPKIPVSQLSILPEPERHQLLVGFNATVAEYPQHRCIHELFEGQANKQPTATALVYEGQSLSYGGLNRCANRLAHRLIELGIRPDDRVAICAERSLEMVIGLLGILKAGGAYVPLDPGYPEERLAYMLSDSAPVAVLTQSGLQARLPGLSASLDAGAIPVILLDGEGQEARPMGEVSGVADLAGLCLGYPEHNPEPARLGLTSRHLAYVIYTSGSTGQPKGVMVSHANVGRLFAATQAQYRFTADDTWALFHSFAFDFSVWEVWGPLFYGGRLIIIPHHTSRNPEAFYQLLAQERVTVLNQTPSAFRQLIAVQADNPIPHNLRCIIFGGEALEFHSLKPWIERNSLNDTRLINMYGITEITVHATYRSLTEEDIQAGQASNVGKPLDDLQFYILDSHLQPVPIGVAGEIYIGGAGVARGYLNRADLTAERFIADPFGQGQDNLAGAADNGRLYKTGDLGRWLPDGSVEYLGRNDFQVKIRGFRIELGEVEAQLAKCPGVREAVVMAREDVPGDKRLVAYLVAEAGQEPEAAELRGQLSAVLADYMVPSAYVTLSELPLTPNGKLDRKALPAPDGSSAVSRAYEVPQGPTETLVAQIWQELLRLEQVGRHDHFFELGGHSLLAVQLVSRLKNEIGEVSLNLIFTYPVLSSFSFALKNLSELNTHKNIVIIRKEGKLNPLFCVHPRGGQVYYARRLSQWIDHEVPVYGLSSTGFKKNEIPLSSVVEMAACYIEAIRTIKPYGPYRIVGYSSGGAIAYEIANQLIGIDEEVEFLGLIDYGIEVNRKEMPDDNYNECLFLLENLQLSEIPLSNENIAELKQLAETYNFIGMLNYCHANMLIPPEIDIATLRQYLTVYRVSDIANSSYIPAKISIPLYLFAALNETQINEVTYGWDKLIGDQLKLIPIGGDHVSILELPHIKKLGEAISDVLGKVGESRNTNPESNYSPIVLVQSGNIGVNHLFCVAGAGASVTSFFSLSQALDPSIPIYGLQPRGLESNMVPHYDVEFAARAYIKAIREISPNGPYRLLGHSFGGWVVFEMALQLLREGAKIDKLIVLDSEAPIMQSDIKQRYTRIGMLIELVKLYELAINQSLNLKEIDFEGLGSEDQLHLLLSRLIEVKLMPPRTSIDTLRGIVRVFETNINTRYVPQDRYCDKLHLIGVEQVEDNNSNNFSYYQDYVAKWESHASNVNFWKGPGNHITILNIPYVSELAQWINALLK